MVWNRFHRIRYNQKNSGSCVWWRFPNHPYRPGAPDRWHCPCVPSTVDNALYKFKPLFRCAQARHFWVFCWLLIALILDRGQGTLTSLCHYLPPKLKYWTLMRMVRSGQWDADILVTRMAQDVMRSLPPPADGVMRLSGDATRQDKRGQHHPLGCFRRESAHTPYTCGFAMVLMSASWNHCRLPMAIAPINPDIKGHQNKVFRHMLATFEPPSWVTKVIVTGDAGCCANETLRLMHTKGWIDVCAMARTRTYTHGKYVSDLVWHLPRHCDRRRATSTPDGRRRDFWVFQRRATLHNLGDVTSVLSKKRRNHWPKQVRLFVTNLLEVQAGWMWRGATKGI
jgi:hypothetical protein